MKRPTPFGLAGILLVFLSTVAGTPGEGPVRKLQVSFEDDPVTYALTAYEKDRVLYVSLDEFADALGFSHYTNPENQKTVVRVGAHSVRVAPFNPFLLVDDAAAQMPFAAAERDGRCYLPLAHFLEALAGRFPFGTEWSSDGSGLKLRRVRHNIVDFEAEARGNGFLLRIHTTRAFSPSDVAASASGGWLHLTLYGGLLDTVRMASEGIPGVFRRLVSYQFERSAQLSFLFGKNISDKRVSVEEGAVVVSVWTAASAPAPAAAVPDEAKTRWLIDTVVLDPGHGGRDPGTVGRSGTREKDVNLAVAQRLKAALEKRLPQTQVLLTRDRDVFIGLKERTQFANARGGKLFISIHADANTNRSIRGFSTYFLGVGNTQRALEVAQKENSVIQYEEAPEAYDEYQDFEYILNAIALSAYHKESKDLATLIGESMRRRAKIPDQGVHQAGYYVLIGASMPSVLVETAFLSNTHEERLLRTHSFQQSVADALAESIAAFKQRYEKEIG